jgi:tetratricopeptide (TPR) repeat protein
MLFAGQIHTIKGFTYFVKALVRFEMVVTSIYAIFLCWQSGPYYYQIREGELSFRAGDYSNAEQHLLKALHLSDRLPESDVRRIRAVNNLAELYRSTRRLSEAEYYSSIALAYAQKYLAEKAEYVNCINNLAVIYRDRGEYTSSQALFDQALALAARPQYQSYSSQLPVLYTNQGKLFYLTGKYREARVFLNMAMEE